MRRAIPLFVLALAAQAAAQESSALMNKALDEQVRLNIDTTFPQAMQSIAAQTGVRLKEDPVIWDLLPWGRDTKIQARVENVTLREALEIILRKLGLTLVLRDEYVEVLPLPALRRLAQRAGRDELRALDLLASRPLAMDTDRPSLRALLEAIDLKLAAEKDVNIAIENRTGDVVRQDRPIFVPRNATLMDALESIHRETTATWYPWGRSVLVVAKEECTRRVLSRPFTIRPGERGMDVLQLLLEISSRTGVPVDFQPGVMQTVAPEHRHIRGVFENAPAMQILSAISGHTGLSCDVRGEQIYVSAGPTRQRMLGLTRPADGAQILVPESALPDDLRQWLDRRTRAEIERLRELMRREEAAPATRPSAAGRPAGDL